MEHKPASESPGLRSIEIMTQETRSTDRELFLDLRIEFTARPNDSLHVLDIGENFNVNIESQLVYQIGGGPDISEETLEAEKDKLRKEIDGENEVRPTLNDETTIVGSFKGSCQTTPKRLCTRETVLTPASTKRRLFPPSPLSECSELDNTSSIFDTDEDKENMEPPVGMELSTLPCPPFGHRKRVTAIRVPRTPTLLEEAEQSEQLVEDNRDDLMRPLTPSRQLEGTRRSQSPSKIPIKTNKPFATPDKKPSSAVNSLLLARTPERSSATSKLRLGLSRLEVPNPMTEPGYNRRKTYSPEWSRYWQGAEVDDKPEGYSDINGKNGVQDKNPSSLVHRRNAAEGYLQRFDGPVESPLEGRANSSFITNDYTTEVRHRSPREAVDTFGPRRSPSEDSLVLQSPSTSSQLSMPWNSAEDLIPEDETAYPLQSPQRPLKPKVLPVLDYRHGNVYMVFPKNVMDGVFVCDATLHFKFSTPDHEHKEVDIRCATAGLREPFSLKWGAQYSPTKSFVPAPKLSLVKRALDVPTTSPDSGVRIEIGSEEATGNVQGDQEIQTPSTTQEEDTILAVLEDDLDDLHVPNFQDVVAHFRVLLTALGILLNLSGAILIDKLRSWRPRWIGSWRRNNGERRRWSRAKWLVFFTVAFLTGTVLLFDEHCQMELHDPMYAFSAFNAGYNPEVHRFRPLEPTKSCTRWLRGIHTIHGFFRRDGVDTERLGGVYFATPAYVRRASTAAGRNNMRPRQSGAAGRTPIPTPENMKEVELAKKDGIDSAYDKPVGPDFRCRQIGSADIDNYICIVNDTCRVTIPRSAQHEEGFTLWGWMRKHHPEVLGLPREDVEESDEGTTTETTEEATEVPVEKEAKEEPVKDEDSREEAPLRDKIDRFLGWRGLD